MIMAILNHTDKYGSWGIWTKQGLKKYPTPWFIHTLNGCHNQTKDFLVWRAKETAWIFNTAPTWPHSWIWLNIKRNMIAVFFSFSFSPKWTIIALYDYEWIFTTSDTIHQRPKEPTTKIVLTSLQIIILPPEKT